MKIVFLVSTGGSILGSLLEHSIVRENTLCVVSDRNCGAIQKARDKKIPVKILSSSTGAEFSKKLHNSFDVNEIIYLSFYTRLLTSNFLNDREGYVFNCHPSILPACKGLDGFGDTLNSNSLFIGCTLHEVDSEIDNGRSVIQCALPLDRCLDETMNRDKVFLMQYYSTLQFIKWVVEGKFNAGKNWKITGATYKESAFSPNLDSDFREFFGLQYECL